MADYDSSQPEHHNDASMLQLDEAGPLSGLAFPRRPRRLNIQQCGLSAVYNRRVSIKTG